jgi:hypothetical protein
MLPVNPESSSESLRQIQLQSKIEELNNLESWGSWDVALVSDREIQGVIEETLKSLQLCPNESLNSSLLGLTERVRLDEYTGLELRVLAIKVQNSLKGEIPIFPVTKDSTIHVLEKMKMKELSQLSRVSHHGNKIGNKAIVAKIKEFGFDGESYEGAVNYLEGFEKEFNNLQRSFNRLLRGVGDVPSLIKIFDERFNEDNRNKVEFQGEEFKIERIIDVLERFKGLSSTDLMPFFFNPSFEGCKQLRNFLFSHFDKVSLGVDDSAKEMQARALCDTAINSDIEGLKFLLGLGIPPDLKYEGETALQTIKKQFDSYGVEGDPKVVELLTNAQRKSE